MGRAPTSGSNAQLRAACPRARRDRTRRLRERIPRRQCHQPRRHDRVAHPACDVDGARPRRGSHAHRPQDEAAAHVAAAQETGLPAISSRLALITAGAGGDGGDDDDDAIALYEQALDVPGADQWPFDLARIQLLFGERLRRARATTRSRQLLSAAHDGFQRLGARPWSQRAGNELRATGLTIGQTGPRGPASLTPQQLEIAQLAAEGLTNKEIGERLFLSHRTVGTHLYQIFPKLGITSRAALRDALDDSPRRLAAQRRRRPSQARATLDAVDPASRRAQSYD